jgi:hypothetical protein
VNFCTAEWHLLRPGAQDVLAHVFTAGQQTHWHSSSQVCVKFGTAEWHLLRPGVQDVAAHVLTAGQEMPREQPTQQRQGRHKVDAEYMYCKLCCVLVRRMGLPTCSLQEIIRWHSSGKGRVKFCTAEWHLLQLGAQDVAAHVLTAGQQMIIMTAQQRQGLCEVLHCRMAFATSWCAGCGCPHAHCRKNFETLAQQRQGRHKVHAVFCHKNYATWYACH